MLTKNARLENMFRKGFRPLHALWIDTYNQQYGGGITFTILARVGASNHYWVAVEL